MHPGTLSTLNACFHVVAIWLSVALWFVSNPTVMYGSAQDGGVPGTIDSSRRMTNGRLWTTENLNLDTGESYCYGDAELNCRRYGRLYSWEAAERGCRSLGAGWRLPTDEDWRQMASHYGGVFDDADDRGRAAFETLLIGGGSGFDALLGGGRAVDGAYDDLEGHGFYWTVSEDDPATAWFYNFARGSLALYRQPDGEKEMALSVRCVQ